MYLTRPLEEARRHVLSIPHKSCAKAVHRHWNVSPDGKVRAQSVYWLYCWAKTGMNSEEARQPSVRVFDAILPVTFARFDAVTNHEYARLARYASADIEHELEETLARLR